MGASTMVGTRRATAAVRSPECTRRSVPRVRRRPQSRSLVIFTPCLRTARRAPTLELRLCTSCVALGRTLMAEMRSSIGSLVSCRRAAGRRFTHSARRARMRHAAWPSASEATILSQHALYTG
eukprot:6016444-Prymnesium_polylepis.1